MNYYRSPDPGDVIKESTFKKKLLLTTSSTKQEEIHDKPKPEAYMAKVNGARVANQDVQKNVEVKVTKNHK